MGGNLIVNDLAISECIKRDGFTFIGIDDASMGLVFSFTIGLKFSYSLPEIVFIGDRNEADILVSRMLNYRGIGLTTQELIDLVDINGEALRFCVMDEDIKSKLVPQIREYYDSIGDLGSIEAIWIGRISEAYPFDALIDGADKIVGRSISKLNH